jgi:hypothetical protein
MCRFVKVRSETAIRLILIENRIEGIRDPIPRTGNDIDKREKKKPHVVVEKVHTKELPNECMFDGFVRFPIFPSRENSRDTCHDKIPLKDIHEQAKDDTTSQDAPPLDRAHTMIWIPHFQTFKDREPGRDKQEHDCNLDNHKERDGRIGWQPLPRRIEQIGFSRHGIRTWLPMKRYITSCCVLGRADMNTKVKEGAGRESLGCMREYETYLGSDTP